MTFLICHVFLEKKMSPHFLPTIVSGENIFSTVKIETIFNIFDKHAPIKQKYL